MKRILLVSSLFIFAAGLFAQQSAPLAETWTVQTSNTTATLYAVNIVDQNVAWACGTTGKVIKTTNGGTTWTAYTLPVATEIAYVIKGIDANTCLVSTSPSTGTKIFRTTDGGTTWTEVYNQTGGFIDGIHMFDANNGYAIGDPVGGNWTLLKTTNGGVAWTSAATLPQAGTEAGWNNSLLFLGNTGYFGTNNTKVYKTTDAGVSWTATTTATLNSYILAFLDANTGMLGGTGAINVTSNGGTNWTAATSPFTTNALGLSVLGADNYFLVGSTNVYKTTNNGAAWTTAHSGTTSLYHIDVRGNLTSAFGYAVGASGKVVKYVRTPDVPTVTVTAPNGGESWGIGTVKNITWTSANIANVAIKYSTDNGTNWTSVSASTPATPASYPWTVPNTSSTQCKVRVSDASNDQVFDVSDAVFSIATQQTVTVPMSLLEGWNMVAVPVRAVDMTAATLFSGANSQVFGYNNGYITQTTLVNGAGYWVRYPSTANFNISGISVAPGTVPLTAGWNMVGVLDLTIPAGVITTTPTGILNSQFFGFNNGYQQVTTLERGKGYWVRATQAGVMNVPVPVVAKEGTGSASGDAQGIRLFFTDANGNTGTLFVSATGNERFDLPPVPPAGVFDVRFASQRNTENVTAAGTTVQIRGAVYPLIIRAESGSYRVRDLATGGKMISAELSPNSEVILRDNSISMIELSALDAPMGFSLRQNYPNPFNPATVIAFTLPADAKTRVEVTDLLGQVVAVLADEVMQAGNHSVEFRAGSLPSGTYLYRISSGGQSLTRKMNLIK